MPEEPPEREEHHKPEPIGPLGPPTEIRHEKRFEFEQLSLDDLAKAADILTKSADQAYVYIIWKNGSITVHDQVVAPMGDALREIVQVEEIQVLRVSATWGDDSSAALLIETGSQALSSRAKAENSEAQRHLYKARNFLNDCHAVVDSRRDRALTRRGRTIIILTAIVLIFLGVATFNLSIEQRFSWRWVLPALLALGFSGLQAAVGLRRLEIPELDPITLRYALELVQKSRFNTVVAWAQVVGAVAGVVAIIVAILQLNSS